ncbi:TRAP transporter small permease subunit [Rhodospirillaceae bacterium KN72]|uniref:TRAP transporter small permease protein n=1 Tax=Pacificispira spongiicola TaxID=2729598 RepID=A0A7Y0HD18_9PROT|nr:TRAP transporter small permease subunit [Pacificispira spongiicola]NMM43326.1 TRAP transporter small permease subunit [Pacificispira spongiicola]
MTIGSIQRPFHTVLRWLLITAIGTLLTVMTVQIVLRYGFNSSLLWAEEICRYILIWLSFLGIALAYDRGEVAALSFLGFALPRVPALIVGILCGGLSVALCIALVYYGIVYAQRAGGSEIPAMHFILEDLFGADAPDAPGTFWVYISLPVGIALLGLRLLADVVLCARAIVTGGTLRDVIGHDLTEVVE